MCNYNTVCPISNGCSYCCRSCCPRQQHGATCISCCPPRIETTPKAKSKNSNNAGPSSSARSLNKSLKATVDNAAGLNAGKSDATVEKLESCTASTLNRYSQLEESTKDAASKLPTEALQPRKLLSKPISKASYPKYSSWSSKFSSTGSSSSPYNHVTTTQYKTTACGTDDRSCKSAKEKKKRSRAKSKIKSPNHTKSDNKEQLQTAAQEGDLWFQCSVPVRINLPNILTLKSAAMTSQYTSGLKRHNAQFGSADEGFCIYVNTQTEPNEPQPPEEQTTLRRLKNGKLTYNRQKPRRSTGSPKRGSRYRERNTIQDDDIDMTYMRGNYLRATEAYHNENENRTSRDTTYMNDTETVYASNRNLPNLRPNERALGQRYRPQFPMRDNDWESPLLGEGNQKYYLEDPLEIADLNQLRQRLYSQQGYTNLRDQIKDRGDGYKTNSLSQSLNNAISQTGMYSRSDRSTHKRIMRPKDYRNQSTKQGLITKSRNNSSSYEDEILQAHYLYPKKQSIIQRRSSVAAQKYAAPKRLSFENSATAEPKPTTHSYSMQPHYDTKSSERILFDKLNADLIQQGYQGPETAQPKENYCQLIFEALLKAVKNLSNLNLHPNENIDTKTTSPQQPNCQVSSTVDSSGSATSSQTIAESTAAAITKTPYSINELHHTYIPDSGNRTNTHHSEAVSVPNPKSEYHHTNNDVVIPAHANSADATGESLPLVLNHTESTIASRRIKPSTGDSFLDYIFSSSISLNGVQTLHESLNTDHENEQSIRSRMGSSPNTELKQGSSGNNTKHQKTKLPSNFVLATKSTTKNEENLEKQKLNESINCTGSDKGVTYDEFNTRVNPRPIVSKPDRMNSAFEPMSKIEDENLKLAKRNLGQSNSLDRHIQKYTLPSTLYSKQASKDKYNSSSAVQLKHGHNQPVQTKALLLPRFFSNSESNIRVPSFTDMPISEEAESRSKKTVLFETTAVCNLHRLIEACSRPPSYISDGTCTAHEIYKTEGKRERTQQQKQQSLWQCSTSRSQHILSQPQLQSESDTSLVLMPIADDQTLRSSHIEQTRICCNPNCEQNATILIPMTTISEVPTAFYRQTIQKYGIHPMDSNFKNGGPCHRCPLYRQKMRSYGGFYTYVPDGRTTALLDPPQVYSEPALVHASYQTVVATEQPSTTQSYTDGQCSYFSASLMHH